MTLPFVISLPHGSGEVPPEVSRDLALTPHQLLASVDQGTFEIFGSLPVLACVKARWARLVVDLNRKADNLGPKGVIARTDYLGRSIFRPGGEPDDDEAQRRLQEYYWPYHQRLQAALDETGAKVLLDCHSMIGVGPRDAPDPGQKRADLVLGNNGDANGEARSDRRRGPTCPRPLLERLAQAFSDQGFSVAINQPYPGGYITQHYGPQLRSRGGIALQIEINKRLFLDPPDWEVSPQRTAQLRERVLAALSDISEHL